MLARVELETPFAETKLIDTTPVFHTAICFAARAGDSIESSTDTRARTTLWLTSMASLQ
jgi:hypothetical protein